MLRMKIEEIPMKDLAKKQHAGMWMIPAGEHLGAWLHDFVSTLSQDETGYFRLWVDSFQVFPPEEDGGDSPILLAYHVVYV